MKTSIHAVALLVSLSLVVEDLHTCIARAETNEGGGLSSERYNDPKNNFVMTPPGGWEVQHYPDDPRGKVGFLTPHGGARLGAISKVVDFDTMEGLLDYCRNVEKKYGFNTNIEVIDFEGYRAVARSFEQKGLVAHSIDFLVGSVLHNLMYSAPKEVYGEYLPVAELSMKTYEALSRAVTDEESTQHTLARKIRLAELMIEFENWEHAIGYIEEGLRLVPDDQRLLTLRDKITVRADLKNPAGESSPSGTTAAEGHLESGHGSNASGAIAVEGSSELDFNEVESDSTNRHSLEYGEISYLLSPGNTKFTFHVAALFLLWTIPLGIAVSALGIYFLVYRYGKHELERGWILTGIALPLGFLLAILVFVLPFPFLLAYEACSNWYDAGVVLPFVLCAIGGIPVVILFRYVIRALVRGYRKRKEMSS